MRNILIMSYLLLFVSIVLHIEASEKIIIPRLSREQLDHCNAIKDQIFAETGDLKEAKKAYGKEYYKIYRSSNEYKAKQRAYEATYEATDEYKAKRRAYKATDEFKAKQRAANRRAYEAKMKQKRMSDLVQNDMSTQNASNSLNQSMHQSDDSSNSQNQDMVDNDFEMLADMAIDELDNLDLTKYTN